MLSAPGALLSVGLRPPSIPTLFPYTTLFRSARSRSLSKLLSIDLQTRRDTSRRRASSRDRKRTRLNSSHVEISYAVLCLKKKAGDAAALPPRPRRARPNRSRERQGRRRRFAR